MYCPYCGNQISDDANFCSKCGKVISAEKNFSNDSSENSSINDEPNAKVECDLEEDDVKNMIGAPIVIVLLTILGIRFFIIFVIIAAVISIYMFYIFNRLCNEKMEEIAPSIRPKIIKFRSILLILSILTVIISIIRLVVR